MTTSSEDVLLQMGEVRYKKGDGTLYVMNERLAWMAENRDTVAVSHRFQDIKMQKISPEGKPKVQLQVVLHDGNSSTFHFVNRNGQAAQIADRDKVKELLQQLLPNFKRKVDRELEEKNRILSENPHLLQLYKDLVITQVLTSEEFWSTYAASYTQDRNTKKQEIGVSGAFLADIKPQTDGCNGLRYNLTADIIHCIFKTYPTVKRKHQEYVPSKLSESEFWTKFFQSHYFHRDRIISGTKDIFTECSKIDDNSLKTAVQKADDPLLDIRGFEDKTLEEGFGNSQNAKVNPNSGNIVHQSIIKRFNQHSINVLKTCTDTTDQKQTTKNAESNSSSADVNKIDSGLNGIKGNKKISNSITTDTGSNSSVDLKNDQESPTKAKRQKIVQKICYDDLGVPQIDCVAKDLLEQQQKKSQQLNLSKVERYLHGPVPITYSETIDDVQEMDVVQDQILHNMNLWNQRIPHRALVSATSAVNALGELSPGGALMRGFQEQSLAQLIPPDIEKELRNLYIALNELLKHFWSCFPPTTTELETRAVRMHEALQRFKMAKLMPFEEKSMRELAPLGASLTQHLNQLLQAASRKFSTWQERRLRQHR